MRLLQRSLIVFAILALTLLPAGAVRAQDETPQTQPLSNDALAWDLVGEGAALNNSGSAADLRSALFDGSLDLLGGAAELILSLPSDGVTPLTLDLEARITTGYLWQVVQQEGITFIEVAESTFTPRSRGYGVPVLQTLQLAPQGNGSAQIHLVYSRPFGAQETPRVRLSLTLPAATTSLELSDPTPALMQEESTLDEQNPEPMLELKGLPAAWDWRTKGIVPAVRDQGGCGSCWAFGTVGVMESAIKKAGSGMQDLSEQFLVSCNTHGWGCSGGLTASMYHYNRLGINQTAVGAVLESVKPYTSSNGSCTVAYAHPYRLSGWKFITGSEWTVPTVDAIKSAIYTYGPITAGVCVGADWYGYTSGVFTGDDSCGGYTNHQIILTGWDDATQTWVLRNSWGAGWGEDGYMHIKWHTDADPHSRVGEGTSWAKYTRPLINAISPAGNILDRTPTYKWTRLASASLYQYQLYDGKTLVYTKTPADPNCDDNYCRHTPSATLGYKTYQWRVRANINSAWSAWSAFTPFTIARGTGE